MATVFKAHDPGICRDVAIKFLHATLDDGLSAKRFQQEAETASSLNHPHILTVFETGEWEPDPGAPPLPFFTMEYVPGGSLAERLDGRPWPPIDAARLTETLARAVHAAHAAGWSTGT